MESIACTAIVDDGNADALLSAIVDEQRRLGLRVGGLLMVRPQRLPGCAPTMVLVDIDTRDEYLVSQPMGSASRACKADPEGFARASRVLRNALLQAPDLVVVNRFGRLEAEGRGFNAELLELMAHGIPVLTAVGPRHVDAWKQFTGDAPLLPPDRDQVCAWIAQQVRLAEVTR